MGVLEDLHDAVRAVATAAGPAVVGIRAGRGTGSGVVVAAGRVLTNAHNLAADEVSVTLPDGRVVAGRPLGVDLDGDLAALEADTGGASPIAWGESEAGAGLPIFALANPAGRGLRVSFGLVTAAGQSFRGPRGRRVTGALEHTAALPRGSSGGPVVDGAGRLLGINTHRLGDGLYLAVSAGVELRQRIEALGRGEVPEPRRLGVGLAPRQAARELRRAVGLPELDGLLVRFVEDGGPADRAGVSIGDLIVGAGGRDVRSPDDLHAALDAASGTLTLAVVRGVEPLEIEVRLTVGSDG